MVEADPQVRVRLDLSYDGTEFSGWASQRDRRTVQDVVQQALATVLRVPSVALTVAGRTDAGVHASGQVAHADLAHAPDAKLVGRLAGVLPPDVRVRSIRVAPPAFDARFGALWRRYEYRISDERTGVAPLRRRFVLDHRRSLDVAAMAAATVALLGLHDYAAFCRRTRVRHHDPHGAALRGRAGRLPARSSCRSGRTRSARRWCARWSARCSRSARAAGRRTGRPRCWAPSSARRASRSPPPHGLVLVEVGYPPDDELAARLAVTRARRDA